MSAERHAGGSWASSSRFAPVARVLPAQVEVSQVDGVAALLVVLAPVAVLGVLGWLVVLAALVAPDCVPDAGQPVCYWSGAGADALQVNGLTVWSWEHAAWRLDAAKP